MLFDGMSDIGASCHGPRLRSHDTITQTSGPPARRPTELSVKSKCDVSELKPELLQAEGKWNCSLSMSLKAVLKVGERALTFFCSGDTWRAC